MNLAERFAQRETANFRRFFPAEMFTKYQEKPNRQVELFKTLDQFGFKVKADQDARNIVEAELAASRFGPSIHFIQRENQTEIYSSDVETVIKAGVDIWANVFDFMDNEARKSLDELFKSK
jgi:hypothetical protein